MRKLSKGGNDKEWGGVVSNREFQISVSAAELTRLADCKGWVVKIKGDGED